MLYLETKGNPMFYRSFEISHHHTRDRTYVEYIPKITCIPTGPTSESQAIGLHKK